MNIVRAVLTYKRLSPLFWVTFDTESGQMIDCSIHPSHAERTIFEAQHWSIKSSDKGDLLIMTPKKGHKKERKIETLTEIKIGAAQ